MYHAVNTSYDALVGVLTRKPIKASTFNQVFYDPRASLARKLHILCENHIVHLSSCHLRYLFTCSPVCLFICLPAVSIPLTLKEIENELREVTAANWYPLGIQLGLRPAKLREIESNNARDAQRCKLDILDWWLENAPVISWQELANAVEGMGGQSNVVQKLRKMSQS